MTTDAPAEPIVVTLDMRDPRAAIRLFLGALPPKYRNAVLWGEWLREANRAVPAPPNSQAHPPPVPPPR